MKSCNIKPDIYTYTSLIKGFISIRERDKAKRIYNEMLENGIEPNSNIRKKLYQIIK